MAQRVNAIQLDVETARMLDAFRRQLETVAEGRYSRRQAVLVALCRALGERPVEGSRDAEILAPLFEAPAE